MQYAVAAALTGDRSHQAAFRAALAERARVTTETLNAIPGMRCVAPRAAFYAMPLVSLPPGRTDEDYVLALLRETGILCVNGSGFGVPPEQRLLPHRVPGGPARPANDLRRHRRLHGRLPRAGNRRLHVGDTRQRDDPRALIRYALVSLALTFALVVAALSGPRRAAPDLHRRARRDRPLAARRRHSSGGAWSDVAHGCRAGRRSSSIYVVLFTSVVAVRSC